MTNLKDPGSNVLVHMGLWKEKGRKFELSYKCRILDRVVSWVGWGESVEKVKLCWRADQRREEDTMVPVPRYF
jgi:hypothetical protein